MVREVCTVRFLSVFVCVGVKAHRAARLMPDVCQRRKVGALHAPFRPLWLFHCDTCVRVGNTPDRSVLFLFHDLFEEL